MDQCHNTECRLDLTPGMYVYQAGIYWYCQGCVVLILVPAEKVVTTRAPVIPEQRERVEDREATKAA